MAGALLDIPCQEVGLTCQCLEEKEAGQNPSLQKEKGGAEPKFNTAFFWGT